MSSSDDSDSDISISSNSESDSDLNISSDTDNDSDTEDDSDIESHDSGSDISISSDTEDDSDIEVSSDSSCNDSTGISSSSSSSSSSDSETELVQKFSTNSVKGLVALIFEKRIIACSQSLFTTYYSKLNCTIDLISKCCNEYDYIKKYVESTHGPTHKYRIKIRNIFSVHKTKECEDYAKIKYIGNRHLLWHGTKIENFSSILKDGLLTRPPSNVTRTGKMFGYGIYFADAVTKAAQYCNGRSSSPSGILILAEIALGTPYALTEGEKVSYLPNGTNCVKGIGKYQPIDFIQTEHRAQIPIGPLKYFYKLKTDLKYNEYIIYNENQIHLRYLVVFDT